MKNFRLFALLFALALPLALPAYADALADAKASGMVGERPDGLLGIVGSATPEAKAVIADVNARRLATFKGIAAKQGQDLATVQAVAGTDFIKRTPPGQYVMDAGGSWVKK